MTSSEGWDSVEATANILGRGYDQLASGSRTFRAAGLPCVLYQRRWLPLWDWSANQAREMKDASARASPEPAASAAHLAAAITTATSMDIREKEPVRSGDGKAQIRPALRHRENRSEQHPHHHLFRWRVRSEDRCSESHPGSATLRM